MSLKTPINVICLKRMSPSEIHEVTLYYITNLIGGRLPTKFHKTKTRIIPNP